MNFFPKPKLIAVAQLNDKSQIVIPKEARAEIGLKPGDRVIIALAPFGNALVIAKPEGLEKHLQSIVKMTEDTQSDVLSELKKLNDTL
jgi:AbrB family looped-hinge helix DNA binding protein